MKNTSYRVGAWCWVITGVGHTALEALFLIRPTPASDAAVTAAMRAHTFELGGIGRSMQDVMTGLSLAMGFAIIFVGVLLLIVARSAPQLIGAGFTGLCLGVSLAMLTVAVLLLPTPPIVLLTIACLGFGLALLGRRPSTARA